MFTKLIEALKANRRTIVFTEGPDARILEAASRLQKEDLMAGGGFCFRRWRRPRRCRCL